MRGGYNDNIRLTKAPHDSVWETSLTPGLKFGVARENQGISGDLSTAIRRYAGGSGRESSDLLDREDYFLNTNAYYNTERNKFTALLHYTRDSTLDSALDETGQVIESRATRSRMTLAPSWTYGFNEKTALNLGYQYRTVSYQDVGAPSTVDYDYEIYNASATRQFSPKLQGTLSASYGIFKPDSGFASRTINLQLGISRSFSETVSTSWLAGIRETTSDRLIPVGFCIGAPGINFPDCSPGFPVVTGTARSTLTTDSPVYSAGITKLLETGKLSAELTRISHPGSRGDLLDTTRLSLVGEHRFAETLSSRLSIEYINSDTIVNLVGIPTKTTDDYFRIRPSLTWQWRRELALSADYQYARHKSNSRLGPDSAERNALYISVTYHLPRISISR